MTDPDPSRPAPWLSLLLPVYNVRPWLRDCVESIVAQRVDGIEILLLDDCSTDGSREVMDTLATEHPALVRVLAHERNGGLSAARNTLLSQARGAYVWFVDSDDLVMPGALAALHRIVEAAAPDLVMCDYRVWRERMQLKHRLRGELHRHTFAGAPNVLLDDRSQLVAGLLRQGQLHTWSKIARREVWAAAAPFPERRMFEDIAVIAPLLAATRTYYHAPEPWIGYRQRDGSIMKSAEFCKHDHLLQSIGELHDGLLAGPALSDDALFALEYFCVKTYASLARRLSKADDAQHRAFREATRDRLRGLFPAGTRAVLAKYRRHGWWLRERRARRSLARIGWLEP